MEKFLVTSALPYANGPLHIGHVAGAYLPADIFVRFQRLLENDVVFVSGTDEFGAPISIKAESEGVTPREIVDRYHKSIKESFDGLEIEFDNFSGTARESHKKLAQEFFTNLHEQGLVKKKTTKQWFDEEKERFLADRYVEGICPHCSSEGARGDQCDSCGKLIDSVTLINPVSKISGSKPVIKETTHWYLNLPKFEEELKQWLNQPDKNWKPNVLNFINNFLHDGLLERAITRDTDWGVPVPLEDAKGKVLYVWFDAPIGYISSTIEWAEKKGQPDRWKEYWLDPKTKLIHFIGKDNIIFHTIFFPSFLMKQDKKYVLPHDVPANEFLNLEGQKMSTSKNWTVWVNDFLKYFEGEYLRYYLAAIAPENQDSDFSWFDFQIKINKDLNDVLGNLINRTFVFIKKYFNGKVYKTENIDILFAENLFSEGIDPDIPFWKDNLVDISDFNKIVKEFYELSNNKKKFYEGSYIGFNVRKVVQVIMTLLRIGNRYFDIEKPWITIKNNEEKANETLFFCAELLRRVSILFSPVMPNAMNKLREMMNQSIVFKWKDLNIIPDSFEIGEVSPLFKKIEDAEIDKQLDILKQRQKDNEKADIEIEHKPEIEYDDFMKMEIRIVKILEAEKVIKSNKLIKLNVNIGGEERSVIAGVGKDYKPEELIGKKVPMLINLKPRKVMGVESQAMILAAEDDGKLSILHPDKDVKEGSEIS